MNWVLPPAIPGHSQKETIIEWCLRPSVTLGTFHSLSLYFLTLCQRYYYSQFTNTEKNFLPTVKHFSMFLHNLALEPHPPPTGRGAQGKLSSHFPESEGSDFKFNHPLPRVSLVAQLVKNLPAMQETPVWFLGQEDPLEKGQAAHSSVLGLPSLVAQTVKNPPAMQETWFNPWVRKIPWRGHGYSL